MQKKVIRLLGNLLTCVAIFYIVRKLFSYELDYTIFNDPRTMAIMCILVIVYMMCVILGCLPWRALVKEIANIKNSFIEISVIFTKANLLKYVPGNVFQYVGRNELAVKKEIKHSDVAFSTLIDTIWNLFANCMVAILVYWNGLFAWISYQGVSEKFVILILAAICAIIVVIIFIIRKFHEQAVRLYAKLKSLNKKSFYICLVKNFVFYVIQCVVTSIITFTIFIMISPIEISLLDFRMYIGAILVAWIVGFITPGAPGGLGVREAVLIFLLKNVMAEDIILLGVVISRVVSILGDLAAFVFIRIISGIVIKKDAD